jgi:hypothetical protein
VDRVSAEREQATKQQERTVMPQELVKYPPATYSPDVGQPEPNLDEHLGTVAEATGVPVGRSVESDAVGRAVRDTHARGFGLAGADLGIRGDLPAEPCR